MSARQSLDKQEEGANDIHSPLSLNPPPRPIPEGPRRGMLRVYEDKEEAKKRHSDDSPGAGQVRCRWSATFSTRGS
jgi:hypothetical protein